ncbi:protein-S-isoprenylcysteine O-methyltransferase [Mycobacterium spongiae]|uniref:Isoprenylcysteine carboxylmethyltransferase family protein n=1 Tax=Mycobacterium spongiae TaxID=886343 RepID=A0A975JZ50_9MYCO|nr:protein-S-isoprenylcysteine O-methyltransferase [Mycobacterium spongiae]QUR68387.1 isoprenylcysteine carboxylmethyltransferase family protein [Mycobacterium spongiae]
MGDVVPDNDHASDPAPGRRAVFGGSVHGHWMQLGSVALAVGIYLWRTHGDARWPVPAGAAVLCGQALIRAPHARRAVTVAADDSYVTGTERALLAAAFVTMSALPLVYLATPLFDPLDYRMPMWVAPVGVALAAAGLWLFGWSHRDLGQQWSVTLQIGEHHQLITKGVYGRVRHPMYAALWLLAISQPLLFQNWIAGPPVIAGFGLLYVLRVPREEAMMRATFGDAYAAYCARTGRVVPRLW